MTAIDNNFYLDYLDGLIHECNNNFNHLNDCNWTQTQNYLVRKRALNRFSFGVRLRTNWFWVRAQLQSLLARNLLMVT